MSAGGSLRHSLSKDLKSGINAVCKCSGSDILFYDCFLSVSWCCRIKNHLLNYNLVESWDTVWAAMIWVSWKSAICSSRIPKLRPFSWIYSCVSKFSWFFSVDLSYHHVLKFDWSLCCSKVCTCNDFYSEKVTSCLMNSCCYSNQYTAWPASYKVCFSTRYTTTFSNSLALNSSNTKSKADMKR